MQSDRIKQESDFHALNAIAEEAVAQVNHEMEQYIGTTTPLNDMLMTDPFKKVLGEEIAANVTRQLATPLCDSIANYAGVGAGVLLGAVTPPPFELAGAMAGGLMGRSSTKFGCTLVAQSFGKTIWKEHIDRELQQQIEQAKQQLSANFLLARNRVLTQLVQHQQAETKEYLQDQFNRGLEHQPFYSLINNNTKKMISEERIRHRTNLINHSATYQAFIKTSKNIDAITIPYLNNVNKIISDDVNITNVSEKMIAENMEFLQSYHVASNSIDAVTHVKLNALLHEQKNYAKQLKSVLDKHEMQEVRHNEGLKREAQLAQYRGMEAGFHFIGQLGVATNNKTIATIGSIGAAGTSIAFNAAMLSGSIAGVTLTGWGLAVPYVGIAMAGLTIVSTLLGKKKNKECPQMQALIALSKQLQEVSTAIHERINHLEERMVALLIDIDNKISTQLALVQTITADGFALLDYKIDHIQADLNRLTEIMKSGLTANYLQEFEGCISAIEQYSKINSDRQRDIESRLITLTTWLTNSAYLRNTNGLWCLPANLTTEYLFTSANLKTHESLLSDQHESRLGYIDQLVRLIPNTSFHNFANCDLPNVSLLVKGVEAYLQGRLRLGSSAAKIMDAECHAINHIQKIAENGIRLLSILQTQEKIILAYVLDQYESTYRTLVNGMITGAKARLTTGTVPGFEFNQHDAVNLNHPWPALINSCPFAYVLNVIRGQHGLTMPRIIQKALSMGVGTLTTHYSASTTNASRGNTEYGDWKANHWINTRAATYTIKVSYELNGSSHVIYTATATVPSLVTNETGTCRFKGGGGHYTIGGNYDKVVAAANAVAEETFLQNSWSVANFGPMSANQLDLANPLKSAIFDAIIAKCISAHDAFPAEREIIINQIRQHPKLLNDLPSNLSLLKNMLRRIRFMTCTPITQSLERLWDENDFMLHLRDYHTLEVIIAALKSDIQMVTDMTPRETNIIQTKLLYCRHLLEIVKQHETFESLSNLTELSETLQVSEDIILSADNIRYDLQKENELGSGSFGKVYRACERMSGKPLAIKMLFPGAKLLEAARGELQVIGKLQQDIQSSPYLVKIFGVTRLNERDTIVMEYIPNQTLEYHLYESQQSLTIMQRTTINHGIIHGIAYLHARHIIHADIKSMNILLTDSFEPKIADYGLARVAADTQTTSTVLQSNKTLAGTFHYMAPEFFTTEANGQPTTKTDIYALGVLLWQIITNKKPFDELNGTHTMIVTYWAKLLNGLPVKDYFVISEQVDIAPEATNFYRFFNPMVAQCRDLVPENRPTASDLQRKI